MQTAMTTAAVTKILLQDRPPCERADACLSGRLMRFFSIMF